MFEALLLAVEYELSYVKLAEAVDGHACFRTFAAFQERKRRPSRAAFVRLCKAVIGDDPDLLMFTTVIAQLKSKVAMVKTATLVDTMIIDCASENDDRALRRAL